MSDLQRFLKEQKHEIVALGKKHKYTFTEADVTALAEGELSDEQLGGAAGGYVPIEGIYKPPRIPSPIIDPIKKPGDPGDGTVG